MTALRRDLLNPTLFGILERFKIDMTYIAGEGNYLIDDRGRRCLDFIAQYGAVPFGYNPDFIWEKIIQVRDQAIPSLVQPSLPAKALELANLLAEMTPGDLSYCTFCQSGAEAVEAAIKLARSGTGRNIILSTHNSFHGKTLAALSATGKDSYQQPFNAPAPGFIRIPFNNLEALREILAEQGADIAAFMVEPVQGEGGIIVAEPGYLRGAQQLCSDYGIIFIADEIQTGLGRTGAMFACDHEGIEPDILLLAKAIGGGLLPLGVCISSPRVWNRKYGMLHSSTFSNNNLTCAVGIAVLERLCRNNRELIYEVARKGEYLLNRVRSLQEKYPDVVKNVRGRGLMVGMEMQDFRDCGSYEMAFLIDQAGFTALICGFLLNVYNIRLAPFLNDSMTLRLEPTLTITYDEIDYVVAALNDICKIFSYHDFSKLYQYLLGDCSQPVEPVDYRPFSRRVKYSPTEPGDNPAEKFAFIIHYPGPEDIIANNPSFASFSREQLYDLLQWESLGTEPGICCYMPAVRSHNGKTAQGWLIGVTFGAREMMNMPRNVVVDSIKQAVDKARDLGAKIVGLGALTSVVTRGGRDVLGRGVAITSGNSYTTLMAMEALLAGAEMMRIDEAEARGAVVGATGSIGRACALMLAERISKIALLGNARHPRSSQNRLRLLAGEMLHAAAIRRKNGQLDGLSGWLHEMLSLLARHNSPSAKQMQELMAESDTVDLNLVEDMCRLLNTEMPLMLSMDVDRTLPDCNLIIAASNSPDYVVYSRHLSPGAVVCDVARPADVAPEVIENRHDVLILEGGLVQLPDRVAFGPNLGYRDGVTLACLSETLLLSLEGDHNNYSIGQSLPIDTINYFKKLAQKHGFQLAGLRMGSREISREEIETIYRNARQKKSTQESNCGLSQGKR